MMATQPKPDLRRFIAHTLKGTVSASRSRLVIFCAILFLQFLLVPLIMYLSGRHFPDTYEGMTKKMEYMSAVEAFVGLIKYILLLVLIIMSPAERKGKRRLAKYIVLLGSLYFWIMISVMASVFEHSEIKREIADKSFHENAVPIYGKVVFTSYIKYERKDHDKKLFTIAEKLSPQTKGYIVIVQLNDSVYRYHGLDSIYHSYNYYTKDGGYQLNTSEKDLNISNCLRFIFNFSGPPHKVPALPALGKYVKIMYDPFENGIEMYTDSATAVTPTFDSLPALSHQ